MPDVRVETFGSLEMVRLRKEQNRIYYWDDGTSFRIDGVTHLHVKKADRGDSHRLRDINGKLWYIRPGWLAIEINAEGWTL